MRVIRREKCTSNRRAFTLVELLTVILILGILVSFLLPAINGVRRRTRVAQVKSEISGLEAAIASFKAEFGIEPAGRLRLYATAAGWNTVISNPKDEALRVKSRAFIRQLWPQFDFNTSLGLSAPFVVDSANNNCKDLNGAECLVFLLGGVRDATSGTTMNGFSKNPTAPFSPSGSNRIKPFFDFVASRLVDLDGDSFFEYVDTIPGQSSPYLYFSSNDGRGYSTSTGNNPSGTADWCHTDCFAEAVDGSGNWKVPDWASGNWMQHLYMTAVDTSASTQALRASNSIPHLPKKYQIISPGFGGIGAPPSKAYGNGGLFNPANASALSGTADGDNITNFHSGTLSGE